MAQASEGLIGGRFPAELRAGAHVPTTLQGLDKCSTSAAIGRGGNERYTLATAKRTRVVAAPSRFPRWRFRHYVRLRRGWQEIGISRSTRHDSLESWMTAVIHARAHSRATIAVDDGVSSRSLAFGARRLLISPPTSGPPMKSPPRLLAARPHGRRAAASDTLRLSWISSDTLTSSRTALRRLVHD